MFMSLASVRSRLLRPSATVALCASGVALFPAMLVAQVGHRPDKSPFEDVKLGQSISFSAGWLAIRRDVAGVAPKSAAFGQLTYEAAVGGPALLYARYTLAPTTRTLLAPAANQPQRATGTPGSTMHLIDGGIDVALTGKKSWRHLIPSVSGGVGVVSDFAKIDSGSYQFGVKFAITYGLAVRYVRASGVRLRVDVTNAMWQYEYPDRYFVKATDGTSVLTNTSDRTIWRRNVGITAGVSVPIFK